MKRLSSIACFAFLAVAASVPASTGCSTEVDEDTAESAQAQTEALRLSAVCGGPVACVQTAFQGAQAAQYTIPAAVVGAGALLSAPVVIPTSVVVVGAVVVGGALIVTVMALNTGPSYWQHNGDGSVTDTRTGHALVRSPALPSIANVRARAYSLDGVTVRFASDATATATATATAAPLTRAQCDQLNRQYHQRDACDGDIVCRGVSGANRCAELQRRHDNAKRCRDLRNRYNA